MKITIIYGNQRKGSTYNSVQLLKEELNRNGTIEYSEVFLPADLPEFCRGCFDCILKGEEHCPDKKQIQSVIAKMLSADGVILASPVYALDVSAPMKNLLDHLCYLWLAHRPDNQFFTKTGFVLSTSAGKGTKRTNRTLKLTLDYLGFKRVYSYGVNVAASDWSGISEKKKTKIKADLTKKAAKFYKATINRENLRFRPKTRGIFLMMKNLIKTYDDDNLDKNYWLKQGWLNGNSPYKKEVISEEK
ncbi:NAD(P)H-dependent oxidoreductase [Halanaerobiaceae bacterium Z-7014]|uniref:NAD(P)H-dependent oxidoreductase n=1 Tax=Halonatronomonas betaini TaxID=2778430 RepID=A0A931AP11_9FIRM|nr:NAD(P)H-dependent oxidoreductase [Halonatronomonas betaini]MBF8436252.1 NAD(P)H-dependent oxidoreductase [Halonatronomonas betaini]